MVRLIATDVGASRLREWVRSNRGVCCTRFMSGALLSRNKFSDSGSYRPSGGYANQCMK